MKQLARDEIRRLQQAGAINEFYEPFSKLTLKLDDKSLPEKKRKRLSELQPEVKKGLFAKAEERDSIAKM